MMLEKQQEAMRGIEVMANALPHDDQKKMRMAADALRQMVKMDPVPVTVAMLLVSTENPEVQMKLIEIMYRNERNNQ